MNELTMKNESKIDHSGRTTIPTAIRQKIGAQSGDQLIWSVLATGRIEVQLRQQKSSVKSSITQSSKDDFPLSAPDLREKYDYMFNHPNCLDIGIARGWMPIFSQLCVDIDKAGGRELRFFWRQVKEKMGTPRLHWSAGKVRHGDNALSIPRPTPRGPNAEVIQRITELVKSAQSRLDQVCIACGSVPASLDHTGGYYLNLCSRHVEQRKHEKLDLDLY